MAALRARAWAGDDELAAELEVGSGRRAPTPGLGALPIELGQLSGLLEGAVASSTGKAARCGPHRQWSTRWKRTSSSSWDDSETR